MPSDLTEENFTRHLNTKFTIRDTEPPLELELTEVKGYGDRPGEQGGMERFSVFFRAGGFVPQRTYLLAHEEMGEFQVFLVPVARDQAGFQYEAVFNYHRQV